jgi:hypothetical protein
MPAISAGARCTQCGHPMDPHEFVLVETGADLPEGFVCCPVPTCRCWATWRAGTRSSTPAEIDATAHRVRAALRHLGHHDNPDGQRHPRD